MIFQIEENSLFKEWLDFADNRAIMECDFFNIKEEPLQELLGDFSIERLGAFGEHASGSLVSFYSEKENQPIDHISVAWFDSEGSPYMVISKNLREFLSILPYGMGFIYTVASFIENNMDDPEIFEKAKQRIVKTPSELLEESKKRFIDFDDLLDWLSTKNIQPDKDPIALIINAHMANNDLTKWITEHLS